MFGVILSIFVGIGGAINGIKLYNENNENYNNSINYDYNEKLNSHIPHKTYYKKLFNGKNIEVRYDNKHQVYTYHLNGDVIQKDIITGEKWNISEDERNLKFNNEKNNILNKNKKAILYNRNYHYIYNNKTNFNNYINIGTIYKDTINNQLYLEKRLNIFSKKVKKYSINEKFLDWIPKYSNTIQVLNFYMDLNGMIVCLSDSSLNFIKDNPQLQFPTEEEINRYIIFFNNMQLNGGINLVNNLYNKSDAYYWKKYFLCIY